MAAKYHPTPLSGGLRKALNKELSRSHAMTKIYARQSDEHRAKGEDLIREADKLSCWSWNEKMWSDGGPAQPSPTIGQAVNGGYPMLEVKCTRCHVVSSIDLRDVRRPADTEVWKLESSLGCQRCKVKNWKSRGALHQLAPAPDALP